MTEPDQTDCRYFTTYSGVALPLKLVGPLSEAEIANRNTFFVGCYDGYERLVSVQKRVYDELELEHRYAYHANGQLQRALIKDFDDDSESEVLFDESGARLAVHSG